MSENARTALRTLIAALEHHLELAQNIDVVQERMLEKAEEQLRDAFFTYDDVLFTDFEVELPFEILDEDLEEDFDATFDDDPDLDTEDDDGDDDGVDVDSVLEWGEV